MEFGCHKTIPAKKFGKSLSFGALLGSLLFIAMMVIFLHTQRTPDRQLLVIEKSIVIASEPLQVIQSPLSTFLSRTFIPERGNSSETDTFYIEDDTESERVKDNSTDISANQLQPINDENATDSKATSKKRSFKAKVTLSKWHQDVLRNLVKEKLMKSSRKKNDTMRTIQ
ncbi:uncharacterized protein [Parasteatoda tepidariorum]|uniref:uncharacterized protein n=1 Tax=Parasteatoda tepidariorum TaxID=114398 RepID=UPI00077FC30F|nr:uncharacterized protein LOC107444910 [Parasteatoda tepidariorum]